MLSPLSPTVVISFFYQTYYQYFVRHFLHHNRIVFSLFLHHHIPCTVLVTLPILHYCPAAAISSYHCHSQCPVAVTSLAVSRTAYHYQYPPGAADNRRVACGQNVHVDRRCQTTNKWLLKLCSGFGFVALLLTGYYCYFDRKNYFDDLTTETCFEWGRFSWLVSQKRRIMVVIRCDFSYYVGLHQWFGELKVIWAYFCRVLMFVSPWSKLYCKTFTDFSFQYLNI